MPSPVVLPSRLVRTVAAVAFALAAAFCAAAPPTATDSGAVLALPPPEVPNPSLLPPGTAPPAARPGADAGAVAPRHRTADIVLVLPLKSTDYAKAAEAVRDGFAAAAAAAGGKERVKVIEHDDRGVLAAFDSARATGAPVVVGPLVRDDLRAIAASGDPLPVTIALNQLDDGAPMPANVYTLALAIESDARVLARKARADGIVSIVVIGGDTPLMRRFATAFVGEWLLSGGAAPRGFPFEATPDGLMTLRREIGRSGADGVLIAVDGENAALARSFAPRVPAYTSALVNRDQSAPALRDLEEVQLVDVPWLVSPDSPALAALPRRDLGNRALDRLYALGLDSYRVAHAFVDGVPRQFEIDGATGHIALGGGQNLVREGALAVVRGGHVVAQGIGR
jgi:outer membrane PBP1 activator LpoA protein